MPELLGFKIEPVEDFVPSLGSTASADALKDFLETGRPEFKNLAFVPHRPERPEKSEGGKKFKLVPLIRPRATSPRPSRNW